MDEIDFDFDNTSSKIVTSSNVEKSNSIGKICEFCGKEIQLNPLIATRVFMFPEDPGFQRCLFIFIHSQNDAWQG